MKERRQSRTEEEKTQPRAECHIELEGPGAVTIEGCMGVLSYESEAVRLSLRRRTLLIIGCDLFIDTMAGQTIRVCGHISSVQFV